MRAAIVLLSLSLLPALPSPGEMARIPGGELRMGTGSEDPDAEEDEQPAHRVRVDPFLLDRDEVTVAKYRRCVAARRCRPPLRDAGGPDDPMTWVTWDRAREYCAWADKRLPTEAEWEWAARGDDGRRYPWGDAPDCDGGNFGSFQGEGRCPGNPGRPTRVGSFPKGTSRSGVRDLAGNVWEWVADRYDARYYRRSPKRNPPGPASGDRRVVRGGACCSMFGLPRSANRLAFPPDYADDDIGFRCARDLM